MRKRSSRRREKRNHTRAMQQFKWFNIHVIGDPDGKRRDHAEEKYLNRYWLKSLKIMKDIKPQI